MIVRSKDILNGKWRIDGTRISVETVVEALKRKGLYEILSDYPTINMNNVLECLNFYINSGMIDYDANSEPVIKRLKEYIEKDEIYQNYKKGDLPNPSDFDKFCVQHCEDINYLLSLLKLYSGTLYREHIATHRANDLEDENEELKSNYDRIYNENCKLREDHNINDVGLLDENYKLKKQQKAFIEYLTSFIGLLNDKPDLIEESQRDVLEEVLTKFKEILGGNKDE